MAVTEIITLQTDASGAVTGIEQVTAEMQKLDQTTTKTEESTKSLKAQIREMTNELLNMAEDDPRRQKLIEQLGELKDRAADAADAVRGNTGPAFESMSNTFGIMTGQLANLDFGGLGQSLTQLGSAVGRINFKSLKQELGGLMQGIGNLGKALLANPIFLIGAAIAAAVVYYEELFTLINYKQEQLKQQSIAIREEDLAARKESTAEAEKELELQKLRGGAVEVIYQQEKNILNEKISIAKQEAEINRLKGDTEAYNESLKKQEEAIYNLKLLQANITKIINDGLYAARLNTDAAFKTQEEKLTATKKERDALALIIQQEKEKLDIQNAGINNQKRIFGNTSLINREQQQQYDGLVRINTEQQRGVGILKTEYMIQLEEQLKSRDEEIKLLEKSIKLTEQRIDIEKTSTKTTTERQKEIREEVTHLEKLESKKAEAFFKGEEQRKLIITQTLTDRHAYEQYLEEQNAKKLEAIKRQHLENYITITGNGLKALGDLVSAFNAKDEKRAKKQFQVMKSIQMASAIIDTYKAITGALADKTPIPYYMKVANAAIAGVTGFAQVAKIAQTTYDSKTVSGGGGIGAGGNDGGNNMPTAPAVDFGFLQQTGQPNTVETYVLAGNVANALEARQKIIDQSYL